MDNDYVTYCNEALKFNLNALKKGGQQFLYDKDNEEIFHYTNYKVNEFLNEKEIKKLLLEERLNPHYAPTIIHGYPGSPEGSIWANVLDKMLKEPDFEPIKFVGGVDYGERGDAATAYVIGFAPGYTGAHIEHEYYWANKPHTEYKDTLVLADEMVRHYIDFIDRHDLSQVIEVAVDSAAVPFITLLNNTAEEYGYDNVLQFYQSKKYKVQERTQQIITLAAAGMVTVDEYCLNLIREYSTQTYGKTTADYRHGDDHGTDAVEYGLAIHWVRLLDALDLWKEKEIGG